MSSSPRGPSGKYAEGFTLIEMLISVVLLSVLMVAGGYFITQLLYNSKISLKQKAVDEWGRVDYLLETDIREALAVSIGSLPTGLTCLSSPANPTLALTTQASDGTATLITYYNSTLNGKNVVRRCGPTTLKDGKLDSANNSDNVLITDASLSVSSSEASFVDYSLNIPDLKVTEEGYARLRSRQY